MQSALLEQPHVRRTRALGRFLDGEVDALAFPQKLEHGATNGRSVEKVLHAAFVANEPEPFVNQ